MKRKVNFDNIFSLILNLDSGSDFITTIKRIFVGKPSTGQTVFKGQLTLAVYKCGSIPTDFVSNYMILPYSLTAKQQSVHYFDFDSQRFANYISLQKEPFVYLGATKDVEATFDPKLVNNYYRVSNQEFFTVGPIPYSWEAHWPIKIATHVLKVRFIALPKPGDKEPIYTFLSDKTMPISITHDKRFVFGTGTQIFTTKKINFPLNQFFYIRFVYARMAYTFRYYDCSVEVEVVGHGRDGADLKCKKK